MSKLLVLVVAILLLWFFVFRKAAPFKIGG
jgi:hypothetical protein